MNRKNLRSLAAGVALLMAVGALAGCGGEKKADDSKKNGNGWYCPAGRTWCIGCRQ